jgi:hypothetical protein
MVSGMLKNFFYSFPIQLLVNHFKKNQVLLLCWLVLFAIVTENFGKVLGIPYLFLDPEYMNKVGFGSFLIVGISLAIFTMAFHMTCYVLDSHRFTFLGALPRPFTKFTINNGIIPLAFLAVYLAKIIEFQVENEFLLRHDLIENVAGLLSGYFLMLTLLFGYFKITNKDIFKFVAYNVDKRLKKSKITRVNVMQRLDVAKKKNIRVSHYIGLDLKVKANNEPTRFYDKHAIVKVFDQNHLNAVILEILIFIAILTMGIFRENPLFQIPAAASGILLLTIFIMFTGAISYWVRGWAITTVIIIIIAINFLFQSDFVSRTYKAYGLDYAVPSVEYSLEKLQSINTAESYQRDKDATLEILNNWRNKFPADQNPKMILLGASGGGQRAALWTMRVMQMTDSLTQGKLMKHTMLMTGASGGVIGASYFRELALRAHFDKNINIYNEKYLDKIASDKLNPVIFSLLVNDLFFRYQSFTYNGIEYPKDRGYAFEEQLNQNTEGILNKPVAAYKQPERESIIPMMFVIPTIVNDGRRLIISPQSTSYMNISTPEVRNKIPDKVKAIDFDKFFRDQGSENLRFLSALRMGASFPYITPTISLPSEPKMQIMDAGISDNFGISDAVRFLYVFRDWISQNTSGVIFVSIRDSEKNHPIDKIPEKSLFEKFSAPIRSFYINFDNVQDLNNDNLIEYAHTWFDGAVHKVDFEYIPRNITDTRPAETEHSGAVIDKEIERASLSWRLTSREKNNIRKNIFMENNQQAIKSLIKLLED